MVNAMVKEVRVELESCIIEVLLREFEPILERRKT